MAFPFRVSYVDRRGGAWKVVATFEALADATNGALPPIPDEKFREFGDSSAVGKSVSEMDAYLTNLWGANYRARFGNGMYSVADSENVLYTNFADSLFAFALKDSGNLSSGIVVKGKIPNVVETIQGSEASRAAPLALDPTRLFGLSMTYDGSDVLPPIFKVGRGTGSTPTLMGFGDDPDKLVVITDGAFVVNNMPATVDLELQEAKKYFRFP